MLQGGNEQAMALHQNQGILFGVFFALLQQTKLQKTN